MAGWFWRRQGRGAPEEEIGAELSFHLEMRAREFEAAGLSAAEAKAAAAESFGDVTSMSERLVSDRRRRSRGRRWREWWSGARGDVRRAVRLLRRNPGFAAAIVLTLAASVALVTVWTAVASAYLVRPLPFPDEDRLVEIAGSGGPDWTDPPDIFERAVSWDLDVLSIVGDGRPQSVRTSWVTPGWFGASGARPQLGRLFGPDEAGAGGSTVAVIGHALWQTRWGGDPDIVGRTFTAYSSDRPDDAEVFTIIGVLEPDFWFVNGFTEVLVPLRVARATYMATLRPGVTAADAQTVVRRLAGPTEAGAAELHVRYAQDAYVERVRPVLYALGGAVALVLAIALGNALSLVLVRAVGREQEFAVRAAIGAGRGRIARQLLAEGLVLSAAASVTGVLLAGVTIGLTRDVLPAMLGTSVPGGQDGLAIGASTLSLAVFACVTIGIALAFAPLLTVWRPALLTSLRDGTRGTAPRNRQRMRSALVAAELALSLALVVGAGLLLRSALYLHNRPLGFDPDGVAVLSVALRQSEFPDAATRAELFERMETSIERETGVAASIVGWAPMARWWSVPVETPEHSTEGDDPASAFTTVASPDYFRMLSIPLLAGRGFDTGDERNAEPVAIVSRSLADRLWPGRSAIGQRIRVAPDEGVMRMQVEPAAWRTVVGIVPDVVKTLTGENPPDLYYPVAQSPPMLIEIVVRDATGPVRLDAVRDAVWRVNPDVPLDDVRWLDQQVAAATLPSRFLAWLVTAFGGFALALAAIGIYGVVAYTVNEGRREVAIRMALGATGGRVARAFMSRQAVWLVGGLVAGLAGGRALSATLRSQLHGVSAGDPATWLGATLAVGAIALLATWLPARSAARTEPARVLQGE